MVPDAKQSATFTQHYDPAANQLHASWGSGGPEQTRRAHYHELLAAAQAHGYCRFWLLDTSRREWPSAEFCRWLGEDFARQLHVALGRPVFIAYVLSAAHAALANSPNAQAMECGCAAYDVYPFFFSNEADAQAWLAHQQRLDVTRHPVAASLPASF